MFPRIDFRRPRHSRPRHVQHQAPERLVDPPGRRPARARLTAALALAGCCLACASTNSPREFVNRLTTPNEGVRADLEELEERVRQLEGLLAEGESENSLLRQRLAEIETTLEEVRALATAPPPPVPFEPPPPARVQVLEVTELDDPDATSAPDRANAGTEPEAGENPGRTGAPATVGETDQALYDRAREQFLNRDYVEAELGFQRFLDAFPDNELSDNALYWIGESRSARGDDRGAMAALQAVLHEYPLGNKVPDALLKAGRILERLGDKEGARRRFQEVEQRFPDSEAARLATESLSRLQDEG